jgi:hypothetical protein
MAVASQKLALEKVDITLMQQPSIYIRNQINALPLLDLCSREMKLMRITNIHGARRKYLQCRHTFPMKNESPSSRERREVISYCTSRRKNSSLDGKLMNTTSDGCTGINPKAES